MKLIFKAFLSANILWPFFACFALAVTANAAEDYYAILGVNKTATDKEIKTSVKKKYRELHPDLNNNPEQEEKLKLVMDARNVLLNKESRANYDKGLLVDPRVRVPKEKTWQQLLKEARDELKAADTSQAPFRIWGAQPDPNRGNPMKTLEDWLRLVPEAPIPWESAYEFAWELVQRARKDREVRISLDQMANMILKELRSRIPKELDSLRDSKNIFDVTIVWARSLPHRLESHLFKRAEYSDQYVSPELKSQLMRATYRALVLWLKELGVYSKKASTWYTNNLLEEVQRENLNRKKSAKYDTPGFDSERQESRLTHELVQQDIEAAVASAERGELLRIGYGMSCKTIFLK